MPAERYYFDGSLSSELQPLLEGTEFHHLCNVMRSCEGEIIELVNGKGFLATAKIKRIEKKKAILTVESIFQQPTPNFELILAQAIPRLNRLDFILEKATELGVTGIWLFPGELSERKSLAESQLERLKLVCIAAMKQCGRLFLPEIKLMPRIESWPLAPLPLFFGDLNEKAVLLQNQLQQHPAEKGLIICIGPESGFKESEIAKLKQIGGVGVKLHHNILRTDTASIAALAIITHQEHFLYVRPTINTKSITC